MPNRMLAMMKVSTPPKTLGNSPSNNLFNFESQMLSNIYHPTNGYPFTLYGRNSGIPDYKPLTNYCNNLEPKESGNINYLDFLSINYNTISSKSKNLSVNISIEELNGLLESKIMSIQQNLKEILKKEYIEEIKALNSRISELENILKRRKVCWSEITHDSNEDLNSSNNKNIDTWASNVLMKLNNNDVQFENNETSSNSESTSQETIQESPQKKQKISNLIKFTQNRQRKGHLPEESTTILKQWLFEHKQHAYPNEEEKLQLKEKTNLTLTQINNWFTNARRRILKSNKTTIDNNLKS